jgi:hypothetical protein
MKHGSMTRQLEKRFAMGALALAIAGCGGGGDGGFVPVAPAAQPPAPPRALAKCTTDTAVIPSYEEQRLPNKLAKSDASSFSAQLLKASAFDKFGPNFATALCNTGTSGAATYDEAVVLLKAEGQKLWQAALDRVQGRKVQGSLPQSDDRMLYWARLTMTLALRQWKPDFALSDEQRAALQNEFERASRGQYGIDFPEGPKHKRILVSGFDPFSLGTAGTDDYLDIRIGNPSGATILALDGQTVALADGTTAVIRTFILPVNYGPFIQGMQEDTLGPWFKLGNKRVDASITMSQGVDRFDLEHYNGRYHFANYPGNDNLNPSCSGDTAEADGFPASLECDIFPPERWLGYAARSWQRDAPAQFTAATLPFQKLIDANTGAGILNWDTNQTGGWVVARHDYYTVGPCTKAAGNLAKVYDAAQAAVWAAVEAFEAPGGDTELAYQKYLEVQLAADAAVPPSPMETNCATSGGGGNYLSNASAYRNTLLRDNFKLQIPAGHIHTPVMTVFGEGSDSKITDATFEARRDAIVAQARSLVVALANNLAAPAVK